MQSLSKSVNLWHRIYILIDADNPIARDRRQRRCRGIITSEEWNHDGDISYKYRLRVDANILFFNLVVINNFVGYNQTCTAIY